jgi:hypothetical protein
MRKANPESVRDDFLSAIDDICSTFEQVEASTLATSGKKLVAEHSLLAAAILWEGFVSDLIVAYINRDSSGLAAHVASKTTHTSSDEVAKRAVSLGQTSLKLKPHLTTAEVRELLDSRGFNITFKSTDDLKEKAGQWLANAHSANFTGVTAAECSSIEAWQAIRNFLAHRSSSAKLRMQKALADPDLPVALARGAKNDVNDVGSFLRAVPVGQSAARMLAYLHQIRVTAQRLCP